MKNVSPWVLTGAAVGLVGITLSTALLARPRGRRDERPLWQDRPGRSLFLPASTQNGFYLLDRMYSERLQPEYSPDGRGIRWVGRSSQPVPISVSGAALDWKKAQRAARGVERYREAFPWRH